MVDDDEIQADCRFESERQEARGYVWLSSLNRPGSPSGPEAHLGTDEPTASKPPSAAKAARPRDTDRSTS